MTDPLISVVLPVYNAEAYLAEAVESVLNQTFGNFELIIVDDGSRDASMEIIEGFSDPRIKVLAHTRNMGLVAALNNGLAQAKGRWIARMDADDVSMPLRFEKQLAHLKANDQLVLLGTGVVTMSPQGHTMASYSYECEHESLLRGILLYDKPCQIVHPSVMMSRDALARVGGYGRMMEFGEDIALWLQLSFVGKLGNIPERLLKYRIRPASHSKQDNGMANRAASLCARLAYLVRLSGGDDPLNKPAAVKRWHDIARAAIEASAALETANARHECGLVFRAIMHGRMPPSACVRRLPRNLLSVARNPTRTGSDIMRAILLELAKVHNLEIPQSLPPYRQ